ncbi:DUF397 domain-containing protein [Streptomyces sp. B-S-A8]|uniref:DUF397 domain-containing protein n=1 Tax=Streptomyces solicavernae TaxID=3043614 RepID=A0ABT6RPU2_9ACTN|nr:DUF397 domain-containing protein [Streptomyces sp. B-S-A8]MDI3386447.1 DUF397 domain-containing protein [Streptomyces sp. B-S-A8]
MVRGVDFDAATWRKSSYSNQDGGNCIEISDDHPTHTPVRDSKNAQGPVLVFESAAWASFVSGVRAGSVGLGQPQRLM